jgi:hypothetical protein
MGIETERVRDFIGGSRPRRRPLLLKGELGCGVAVWVAGSGETKMPFLAVPRVRPRGTARSHTTYLDRPAGRTWTGLVRRSTSTTISRFRDGYVHISSIFKECRQPSIFSSPAREITVFVSKPLPTG